MSLHVGALLEDGAHANETLIFDGASSEEARVANSDVVANDSAAIMHLVQWLQGLPHHCVVLDVREGSYYYCYYY